MRSNAFHFDVASGRYCIFETWFSNHFLVYAPPSRPLLLLMDGHASLVFVNRAAEEQIIVFCLPPHSSHKTQPLDKGVFSPLKENWREECHLYVQNNPGKVVTRYSFSEIFKKAWMRSMTPANIVSGLKITGIYPTDRSVVIPAKGPVPEKYSSICERTGLKFIPLFTPVRQSLTPYHDRDSASPMQRFTPRKIPLDLSPPEKDSDEPPSISFTQDEITKFTKRKEEGFDITSDSRYTCNLWLSLQPKPDAGASTCKMLEPQTSMLKSLLKRAPLIKQPDISLPKLSARVLTSEECRKSTSINDKQIKKMEEIKRKEERKMERERNRLEKEQKAKEVKKRTYKRAQAGVTKVHSGMFYDLEY